MVPERPPEYPSMNPSLKDVASVYDKTMKDKKRLKTKSIIVQFFPICSLFLYLSPFVQQISSSNSEKKMLKWKNIYGKQHKINTDWNIISTYMQ